MIINHNNLEEYTDPVIYDCENNKFEPDGLFYLALAQRLGVPVLEIGCGTGRITIPLAQHGIDITGLDVVSGMLERARSKAGDLAIRWVEADARAFHLNTRFRLIFESGAVFQHMLGRQDQEALLAQVREHLAPDGCFAVSLRFPHKGLLENVESEQEWYSYLSEQGRQISVSGIEYYDPVKQIKLETAYRRWRDPDGQQVTRCVPESGHTVTRMGWRCLGQGVKADAFRRPSSIRLC